MKIKGRNNYVVLDNTNIHVFTDHIGLKAQADYSMRSVITDGRFDPPKSKTSLELAQDGFSEKEIPDMVVKLYIENQPRVIKYDENKKALYAYIMFHVSAQSLIHIKGDAKFAEAEEKMCPLLLWKIIERTHRGSLSSKCERINKNRIIEDYEQIKMGVDENIIIYHDRFIFAARTYYSMKKLDIKEKNNDIEVAWAFWRSLNKQTYGEFLRNTENNLNSKSQAAEISFNDMYDLAQSYISLSKSIIKSNAHAVFATSKVEKYAARLDDDESADEQEEKEETKWKLAKGAVRTKDAGVKEKDGKAAKPYKVPRPIEEIQCFTCRKLGHYKSDCPKAEKSGDAVPANAKP
jgi:hypothetical protein